MLYSQVIDAYLKLLVSTEKRFLNACSISYTFFQPVEGKREVTDPARRLWRHGRFADLDLILVPCNVGGNHWVLMVWCHCYLFYTMMIEY